MLIEQPPWGDVPPAPARPDLRSRIRERRDRSRRMVVALDDDPTGSQAVHGVDVVTVPDAAEYGRALRGSSPTCFVLTNSRSLPEADAVRLNQAVAGDLFALAAERGVPVDLVSRGDSTLRGHVAAELAALNRARSTALGRGYDGVLLVPAYLEAGRVTANDVHWARVGGAFVPVGETEFARDAAFGYRSSNLRDFVVEVSRGAIGRERVRSVSLDDIRAGGPDRVAEILDAVRGADVVVVNALTYQDLETVALAALTVEDGGRSLLYRSGPSFVRALDGQDPQPPLGPAQIWPDGRPAGHGLIVVGSHVGLTSSQVSVLRQRADLSEVELDVPALLVLDGAARAAYVADLTGRVAAGLAHSDVLLLTSRSVAAAPDAATSLSRARQVSAAVSTVVRGVLAAGPAWVLAKGGITSHDVAVTGLGIRRAEVVGQFFDGMVSLYRPAVADARAVGRPFVVFAGNVGDQAALAEVATRLATPAMEGG